MASAVAHRSAVLPYCRARPQSGGIALVPWRGTRGVARRRPVGPHHHAPPRPPHIHLLRRESRGVLGPLEAGSTNGTVFHFPSDGEECDEEEDGAAEEHSASTPTNEEFFTRQGSSFFSFVPHVQWRLGRSGTVNDERLTSDPGLNQLLISEGSSISQLWEQDMWERHRGISRYWRHIITMWRSTVFLRALEPVMIITTVAVAIASWNHFAPALWSFPQLYIAPLAHSLAGAALSLSLVFRANNANARVVEARGLLATMVKCIRDLVRMSQYIPQETGQCREQILDHCRAIPYAVMAHVRKGRSRPDPKDPTAFKVDPVPDLARVLGEEKATALLSHPDGNLPAHLLLDMSTILQRALTIGMSTQMHQQTELVLKELSHVVAGSEKILMTPIPVSYTRHTSRTLVIWLLTLPLALWGAMGWAMVPAIFLITFLLIGVDEIGVQIEEPFCILPVQPLCEMVDREVTGMKEQALRANDFKPAPKK